jgi:hypothetical protein
MTEVKGIGRGRTQLRNDLRNRVRYWELKEEAEDGRIWNDGLSIDHNEEIQVILYKSMDMLISSILWML